VSNTIRVEIGTQAERVAVVTLTDHKRRNAVTPTMNRELIEAFDGLEANTNVGAVVITGDGSSFCAGADLAHLGATPSEDELLRIYDGFLRVARSPLPTVAAVNGPAVGAGVNMALCCDIRLAGMSARFDTRFLQLGIHPGGGHTWMMRNLVGPQVTLAAVLFGEVFDGPEAAQLGLVFRCVSDDELLAVATKMAERAATAPAELSRRVKATIASMGAVDNHDQAIADELTSQWWSMARSEFAERVRSLQGAVSKDS
jgi:enoyl-CoA hydratase